MGNTLLITKIEKNGKACIASALFQDKKLLEISLEAAGAGSILGNIYIGRVKNIVKNLNAAFIEIAPGKPCYYNLEDIRQPLYTKKINSPRMVQGDEVVVQVVQENSKSKPPKVSTNLNLAGKYLVVTSENCTLGISRKLDADTRERLRKALPFQPDGSFGVIVRTNAAAASTEELLAEYRRLEQEYLSLKEKAPHRTVFSCLKASLPEYLHALQSMDQRQLGRILTDDKALLGQIESYLEESQPEDLGKLSFYEDPLLSLNSLYSLGKRIQEALQERVWMKSGGYLVIQPTEALTVIDVNSGKSIAKKQVEEHHLKINLEAAGEIARQIRLRNISGIIIVDFIDMKDAHFKEMLLQSLRSAVRTDSVPVQVVGMTKLDLVEITRKKVKKTLAEQAKALF
ncbi:MAG: ribonuclease E/G [Lachnospiraceae bacterium]|jgi:ribonuclease G|nr:ribonuclease E/G [Lachnospiraceae bacterium]